MPALTLENRRVIVVRGPDAHSLLQNIVTRDLDSLEPETASACALLTPQGKILFDFVISRSGEAGFKLDLDASLSPGLVKRLALYKLRADVEIFEDSGETVTAVWDEAFDGALVDTRFAAGTTVARRYGGDSPASADRDTYDLLRIEACVAESGRDFTVSDAFPHDVLFDRNGAVSFRKGCFVGQEVVSRMQHRGSARKRLIGLSATEDLPDSGTPIEADGRSLGALGTVVGKRATAIVRVDRMAEAVAEGHAVTAAGRPVSPAFPAWTGLSLKAGEPAAPA